MQHKREQITAENKIKDRGQGGESKYKESKRIESTTEQMTVVENKAIQHTHNWSSPRRKPMQWHKGRI